MNNSISLMNEFMKRMYMMKDNERTIKNEEEKRAIRKVLKWMNKMKGIKNFEKKIKGKERCQEF